MLNGAHPDELPLPWGSRRAYSPDGARLAYVPLQTRLRRVEAVPRRRTTPIWLATSRIRASRRCRASNSNDFNPMWVGDKVYFLSDRDGPVTLFSYDTALEAGEAR